MKNIEKAKLLEKTLKFFKDNNLNIEACGCCGGYHLMVQDEDLCEGTNFNEDIESSIEFYKKNVNKVYIEEYKPLSTKIEFIKDGNKLVNLGGRSYPFRSFINRRKMRIQDIIL